MATPMILGRSFKQAHAYATETLGLSVGHYRVVNSPGTIKAVRGTVIYLLEGWNKRPDRFSMQTAMRYCHNEIIDTTVEAPPVADPRGNLTERQLEVAYRYNALRGRADLPTIEIRIVPDDTPVPEHHTAMIARVAPHLVSAEDAPANENTPTVVSPEAEALAAEKPKAKRRSKCKDCGNLHYRDEACPESETA